MDELALTNAIFTSIFSQYETTLPVFVILDKRDYRLGVVYISGNNKWRLERGLERHTLIDVPALSLSTLTPFSSKDYILPGLA